MCFLLKYGSWKLQLESWNTNHESFNRSLKYISFMSCLFVKYIWNNNKKKTNIEVLSHKLWCNFASIFKFHNPKNVNLLAAVKNWNLTCHSHSCQLTINKGTTKDAAKNVFMCKFWTGLQEHCTYFHTNYFADTTFSHVVTYIAPTVKHFEFYIHKILLEMFSLEARSKDLP